MTVNEVLSDKRDFENITIVGHNRVKIDNVTVKLDPNAGNSFECHTNDTDLIEYFLTNLEGWELSEDYEHKNTESQVNDVSDSCKLETAFMYAITEGVEYDDIQEVIATSDFDNYWQTHKASLIGDVGFTTIEDLEQLREVLTIEQIAADENIQLTLKSDEGFTMTLENGTLSCSSLQTMLIGGKDVDSEVLVFAETSSLFLVILAMCDTDLSEMGFTYYAMYGNVEKALVLYFDHTGTNRVDDVIDAIRACYGDDMITSETEFERINEVVSQSKD